MSNKNHFQNIGHSSVVKIVYGHVIRSTPNVNDQEKSNIPKSSAVNLAEFLVRIRSLYL